MSAPSSTVTGFQSLAVVGVGLMGGSLALAARNAGVVREVIGLGRSASRLQQAVELGILDRCTTSVEEIRNADFVVVCTPVDQIAQDVRRIADVLKDGALITDVGSVKGTVCGAIGPDTRNFIGSHPLAGSEKGGFENSHAELYRDRMCVVTPTAQSDKTAVTSIEAFWKAIGMRVCQMSPAQHDAILALTSHLPHVAASALASLLTSEAAPLAATGFRDTTRVAEGDAELWAAILGANAKQVTSTLEQLIDRLADYRDALATDHPSKLIQLLESGRAGRKLFTEAFHSTDNES